MDNNKDIRNDELEKKLREHSGTDNIYEVPDGYFDKLPQRALENARRSNKSNSLRSITKQVMAAAAILLIGALVITYVFSDYNSNEYSTDELSFKDIYTYSMNSLAQLEESYLLSLMNTDSLDMQSFIIQDTSGISNEAIMEYLLAENNIEYLILNEY